MRFIVFLISFVFWASLAMAAPKKVAILPFTVHAPKNLEYVREGIQDMLTSRLFAPEKVETIDPGLVREVLATIKAPLTRRVAYEVGQKLGADYVLFGSVSVFGETVSVDAELLPIKEKKPPITLYTQVKGLGEIIPELAKFAKRSRTYILEGKLSPEKPQVVQKASSVSPASPTKPTPSSQVTTKMHPEKLMQAPTQAIPNQAMPSAPAPQPQVLASPTPQGPTSGVPPVHYTDVDRWPNYPPSGGHSATNQVSPQPQASYPPPGQAVTYQEQPKKKSLLRRIGSKLWPFGKKEKEVKLSEVPPPPPPPPTYQASAPTPPPPPSGSYPQTTYPSPSQSYPSSPAPTYPQTQAQTYPQTQPQTYSQNQLQTYPQTPPAPVPSYPSGPSPVPAPSPQGETWQWY